MNCANNETYSLRKKLHENHVLGNFHIADFKWKKTTTLAGHCRTNRRSGHDTIAGHRTIVALTHVQCVSLDFCISEFRSRVRRATPIVYIASHYIVFSEFSEWSEQSYELLWIAASVASGSDPATKAFVSFVFCLVGGVRCCCNFSVILLLLIVWNGFLNGLCLVQMNGHRNN